MANDPIVDEVRAAREALLARFDGRLDKLFEFLREQEATHPERMANRSGGSHDDRGDASSAERG